jgi:hypothetical protein
VVERPLVQVGAPGPAATGDVDDVTAGHAFAAEPGIEPAPQTADAKLADAAVAGWFRRYLADGS